MSNVVVTMPPVDPLEALDIYPRLTACIGVLWASGRLRPLLQSEEGRDAVHAWESMLSNARDQMASFDGKQGQTMRVRIETPERTSRAMVTFVRRLLDLISDPTVMKPLGQDELSKHDRDFIEPYLVTLETAVAGHEFGKT
jgi:hypothetical protein